MSAAERLPYVMLENLMVCVRELPADTRLYNPLMNTIALSRVSGLYERSNVVFSVKPAPILVNVPVTVISSLQL